LIRRDRKSSFASWPADGHPAERGLRRCDKEDFHDEARSLDPEDRFRRHQQIASQLTWLANRDSLGLPEGRTHERLTPHVAGVVLRLESGREVPARIIDLSMSGVALSTATAPPLGATVMVGRTPGRVVRYFEGGLGVQFMLPISPDLFHEGLTL
jgi:hypothetical protein